ncbi:MAG: DNA polymerase III subunit gamma/tau [Candidatus Limnocylindrales bacterium]
MTTSSPHQALYRRWRAQTFSQIVGQEAVVETLRNAVRTERVSHAILFVGPRGTGKTSLARIVAKAVNCVDLRDGDPCDACEPCVAIREGTTLDVLEIDAASNRGINEVRDLRERLAYPPGHLRRKVYILDEAHQITKDAWNALLKSLEEPPDFVIFMFASTEPSGFPPAILSRLQRYDVRRLTVPEIEGKLRRILAADRHEAEDAAITLVARLAAGGMRDAESILDQLLSSSADTITEFSVRDLLGLADAAAVDGFLDALMTGDAGAGIGILDRLEERGRDPRALLDQVVEAVRTRLVAAAVDHDTERGAALADAARRLVAIDPDRAGIGGLRLQLELSLFAGPTPKVSAATAEPRPAATSEPRPAATSEPRPAATLTPTRTDVAATAGSAPAPATAINATHATPEVPSPSQPPTGTSGTQAGGPTVLSLERIVAAWPEIVARLSQKPAIKQLILTCRPVALDGVIVSLGFPEEQAFLRDVAERKKADIEAGVAQVIGLDVGIRCVVANIEVAPASSAVEDGYLMAEARRIFGEDLVDIGEVS